MALSTMHLWNNVRPYYRFLNRSLFNEKNFLQRLPSLLGVPVKIWGSGYVEINDRKNMELLRRLDVRACRGFLTLERLKKLQYAKIAKNVAIGDPELLASRIIDTSSTAIYAPANVA